MDIINFRNDNLVEQQIPDEEYAANVEMASNDAANSGWSAAEITRLSSCAADIVALLDPEPFSTAALAYGSDLANLGADLSEGVSKRAAVGSFLQNALMSTIAVVPILGQAVGSTSKVVKTLAKLSPKIMKTMMVAGGIGMASNYKELLASFEKLAKPGSKMDANDWRNVLQGVQFVLGGALMAKNSKKLKAGEKMAVGERSKMPDRFEGEIPAQFASEKRNLDADGLKRLMEIDLNRPEYYPRQSDTYEKLRKEGPKNNGADKLSRKQKKELRSDLEAYWRGSLPEENVARLVSEYGYENINKMMLEKLAIDSQTAKMPLYHYERVMDVTDRLPIENLSRPDKGSKFKRNVIKYQYNLLPVTPEGAPIGTTAINLGYQNGQPVANINLRNIPQGSSDSYIKHLAINRFAQEYAKKYGLNYGASGRATAEKISPNMKEVRQEYVNQAVKKGKPWNEAYRDSQYLLRDFSEKHPEMRELGSELNAGLAYEFDALSKKRFNPRNDAMFVIDVVDPHGKVVDTIKPKNTRLRSDLLDKIGFTNPVGPGPNQNKYVYRSVFSGVHGTPSKALDMEITQMMHNNIMFNTEKYGNINPKQLRGILQSNLNELQKDLANFDVKYVLSGQQGRKGRTGMQVNLLDNLVYED